MGVDRVDNERLAVLFFDQLAWMELSFFLYVRLGFVNFSVALLFFEATKSILCHSTKTFSCVHLCVSCPWHSTVTHTHTHMHKCIARKELEQSRQANREVKKMAEKLINSLLFSASKRHRRGQRIRTYHLCCGFCFPGHLAMLSTLQSLWTGNFCA